MDNSELSHQGLTIFLHFSYWRITKASYEFLINEQVSIVLPKAYQSLCALAVDIILMYSILTHMHSGRKQSPYQIPPDISIFISDHDVPWLLPCLRQMDTKRPRSGPTSVRVPMWHRHYTSVTGWNNPGTRPQHPVVPSKRVRHR